MDEILRKLREFQRLRKTLQCIFVFQSLNCLALLFLPKDPWTVSLQLIGALALILACCGLSRRSRKLRDFFHQQNL